MKVINKEALNNLINTMEIESIKIDEPLDNPIDASTLDGRAHMLRRKGEVTLVITGRVSEPDKDL